MHQPKPIFKHQLHDELPGMVVAWSLKQQLIKSSQLVPSITVIPAVNPIALNQFQQEMHLVRFEQTSGQNFNRHYPVFSPTLARQLKDQFSGDASSKQMLIRQTLATRLKALKPVTELDSLRAT
ncbi:M14 family metallopeptidase [Celerinatantimonas yamalensis]|uniref:Uncharacterized protein n=1 Tax=Celerinatantimonas yamalensis TaxID=559956 RepID=A0ABW9G482_9GAMM